MKNRNQYLLNKYYDIDNDVQGNFERLSANRFPKDSIEYADNTLFLMRCELLKGMYRFTSEHFSEVLDIYSKKEDLTGQFFTLTTYGLSCRDNENIIEATRILNRAYGIGYKLNNCDLILCGLVNFICLDKSLNSAEELLKVFHDVEEYLQYATSRKIIGAYHLNYGYMLFSNGYMDEAKEHYYLALDAYSKYYSNKQASNILAVHSNLAELHLALKDYQQAIAIYEDLYQVAESVEDNSIAYDCLIGLVEAYQQLSDYKNAFKYLQLVNEKISLFKTHSSKLNSKKLNEYLSIELDESKNSVILANLELTKKTLELDENIKQLYLIAKVGKKITLAHNEDDLFKLMIDTIYGNLEYDMMGLFIINPQEAVINANHVTYKNNIKPYSKQIKFDSRNNFSAYCVRENTDILIDDLKNQYSNYISIDESEVGNYERGCRIYCRLLDDNEIIGIFTIQSDNKGVYDDRLFQTIKSISSYIAIALSNINKTKLLEEKSQKLEELSYCDVLTGLNNRRAFVEYSESLQQNPDSYHSISLVLADMNHLKLINDNLSHLEGDKYLLEIANILVEMSNNYRIYRLSGDEFGVLILNASESEVIQYIAKVKEECHAKNYQPYPLSLAIGYDYCHTLDEHKLFSNAEKNMYADKEKYYQEANFKKRLGGEIL